MRAPTLLRGVIKFSFELAAVMLVLLLSVCVLSAQKTTVGYDKEVDFAQFRTYSWMSPQTPITRPLLAANVIGAIDQELAKKGLREVENSPDLFVTSSGSLDPEGGFAAHDPTYAATGGYAPLNTTVWTGSAAPSSVPMIGKGMLVVDLVDAKQKNLVWRGTIKANLDPTKKNKALELVNRAIAKLFNDYPPKK